MSRAFFVRVGFKSTFHGMNTRLDNINGMFANHENEANLFPKGSHIMVPDVAWLVTDNICGKDVCLKWCGIKKLVYVYVRYAQW